MPLNNSNLTATEFRNQFNALNDLITAQAQSLASLTLRVAALENPPLTATGFGEMSANGLLTLLGQFAGKPYYQAAGGWWYCWNPDGGMWICPFISNCSKSRRSKIGDSTSIPASPAASLSIPPKPASS